MSRIQQILDKAEREGAIRRTTVPPAAPAGAPATAGPAIMLPATSRLEPIDSADDRGHAYEAAACEAPAFAPVPAPAHDEERTATLEPHARAAAAAPTLHPLLVAALEPHSAAAEQYRSIRARIAMHENGVARRTLVVSSPGQGEGKSVTAVNLALTMGQETQRHIIVVDASLRRPRVHQLLGIAEGPGLADVLAGRVALEEATVALPDLNLTVLPAGLPPAHPAELLASTAMRRVIDTLRTRFDRVILDMPSVTPLADVGTVAPLADGVLLVVRSGATTRPAIEAALSSFEPGKVVGVVLNGAE